MELDIQAIQKILPHRFPFLLIDRVLDVKPGESLTAIKNVSINEGFFVGHFEKEKIMPGVLIIEAMAQAGCIFYYYSKDKQGKDLVYYLAKVEAKFTSPVRPGDQLKIEVTPVKMLSQVGFLRTKAYVKDQCVAHADIGFGIRES